eukprot:s1043_g12.t1
MGEVEERNARRSNPQVNRQGGCSCRSYDEWSPRVLQFDPSEQHDEGTSELYKSISRSIVKESNDFNGSAAEVAIPEPHHPGLPGHGTLVEFCASAESMMGKVGKDLGVHEVRCSEGHLNVKSDKTMEILHGMVESKPGLDLWGSLPCDPLDTRANFERSPIWPRLFRAFGRETEGFQEASQEVLQVCSRCSATWGTVTFEWPHFCAGWSLQEIQKLIRDLNMMVVDFDGCQVGLTDLEGNLHLKRWNLITTCNRTARIFSTVRCNHPSSFQHAPVSGSRAHNTGFYPKEMCEYVMHTMYPGIISRHVPALPTTAMTGETQEHRKREPEEEPEAQEYIFKSTDPMAAAAEGLDEPADDEAEDRQTRDDRLRREATSLEHLTLQVRKHPFRPHCQRGEDSNYDALKHFGGNKLNGDPDVVFHFNTAQELTNAASKLGWVADPSAANHWPHNAYVEREIRPIKEMCRLHRSFFTPAPITEDERDTEEGKKKLGKTLLGGGHGEAF